MNPIVRGARITQPPSVALSLDFELRWGVHDMHGTDMSAYRGNLEGVREAVPALLNLFERYGTHATWATVGAIGCDAWDEYFQRAPKPPQYMNPSLSVRHEYATLDPTGLLHFAPNLIRTILRTRGQELATHTFSHLYLREPGITAEDVAADLQAVSRLYREKFDTRAMSLVFPRNQPAFIDVVRASGIRVWRGNPGPWYYECEDTQHNGPVPRALKLLDSLNPLRRLSCPLEDDMTRASLFLRFSLPQPLWRAHMARIRRELDALRPGEIFHVWFHPHNLGVDMRRRLARLEQVLALVAERQAQGRLVSRTMAELLH